MQVSKFPVTFEGKQYKVSIANNDNPFSDGYTVRVYEPRRFLFAKLIYTVLFNFEDDDIKEFMNEDGIIDFIKITKETFRLLKEDKIEEENLLKVEREFTEWNGEV